jgi:ubiquinone/menaquinone biosynthesis C-methylase UbiE
MGYALRHVADLGALFTEFRRVLKPGGRILILEISRPQSRVAFFLMGLYMAGSCSFSRASSRPARRGAADADLLGDRRAPSVCRRKPS